MTETHAETTSFSATWQDWHAQRMEGLRADPFGWLSITGLDWLTPGATRAYADGRVTFTLEAEAPDQGGTASSAVFPAAEPPAGPALLVRVGTPTGERELDLAAQAPQFVEVEGVRYEVLVRQNVHALAGTLLDPAKSPAAAAAGPSPAKESGDPAGEPWVGIRVRDSHSTGPTNTVVPTFPADPDWMVSAAFEPYAGPRTEVIDTASVGLHVAAVFVGRVTFTLAGDEYRLQVGGDPATGLVLSFHDGTNGAPGDQGTAAWRFVSTGPVRAEPGTAGRVDIDFNRALNYPAGFSPYATCPAPAVGNTLALEVRAGEKRPHR
ncbi:DUF1684 domain-containing protein [Brevibacterium moorei]|uniref:DUF1684 domain-containing protein n=1 Tax=Brevibacterium moorei TaxID=2968457 RepID=UPI00211C5430|nr:DUF1684 domain-containing protein [Brevibacterium sp. 68QC2CO]MCQ9386533.1 DUF1684 domain-containing protein [Brevibacterium sp. 68QC2CO]